MTYATLPSKETIRIAMRALRQNNVTTYLVETKAQALEKLTSLIPKGAAIMTGSSTTLEQIGFVDLLKSGKHPWKNLKDKLLAEKDPAKQAILRKKNTMADYFIGSVHAVTETGGTITASASGSQLPAYAFNSDHLIWVVGAQKIVPTLTAGLRRIREYVLPLEDQRMKNLGKPGSAINMMLIFNRATPNRKVTIILINEAVGF